MPIAATRIVWRISSQEAVMDSNRLFFISAGGTGVFRAGLVWDGQMKKGSLFGAGTAECQRLPRIIPTVNSCSPETWKNHDLPPDPP
jgi:hypothetical protein